MRTWRPYNVPDKKINVTLILRFVDIVNPDTPIMGITKMYRSMSKPITDCGTDIAIVLRIPSVVWISTQNIPFLGIAKMKTNSVKIVYVRTVKTSPIQEQTRAHLSCLNKWRYNMKNDIFINKNVSGVRTVMSQAGYKPVSNRSSGIEQERPYNQKV